MVTPDQNPPSGGGGFFDQPKRDIACRFTEASEALRDTRQRLAHNSTIASAVDRVADTLQNAGNYVESAEPRQVVRDTQNFARRHPEWFLGGALAAGVIIGRFLRSQPPEESRPIESGPADRPESRLEGDEGVNYGSGAEAGEVDYGG